MVRGRSNLSGIPTPVKPCFCPQCRGDEVTYKTWKVHNKNRKYRARDLYSETESVESAFEGDDEQEEDSDSDSSTHANPAPGQPPQDVDIEMRSVAGTRENTPEPPRVYEAAPFFANMAEPPSSNSSSPSSSSDSSSGSDTSSTESSGSSSTDRDSLNGNEDLPDPLLPNVADEPGIQPTLRHLQIAQAFIAGVRNATLDNTGLPPTLIHRLRHPAREVPEELDDPIFRLSIDLYSSCIHSSRETYNSACKAIRRCFGEHLPLLSHYECRKKIEKFSGVVQVRSDMCSTKGCVAFTGPYANLDNCPKCRSPRYYQQHELGQPRKPIRTFTSYPLGPQIQALWRSPDTAREMRYGFFKSQDIDPDVFDDVFCGTALRNLMEVSEFKETDTAIMFTLDGAQLYRNKKSSVYIGAYVVFNWDPSTRYKIRHVLPAFVVPGPFKTADMDSFTFPSLAHLSALQKENGGSGMSIWDGATQRLGQSQIFLFLGGADATALTAIDGSVGHHGALGCRVRCPIPGRHRPGVGIYFQVHLQPIDDPDGPPDFNLRDPRSLAATAETYEQSLRTVLGSETVQAYKDNRRSTGLGKPSIFSGLSRRHMIPMPGTTSIEAMHHLYHNVPDCILDHWTGKVPREETDNAPRPWETLRGEIWREHGARIAEAAQYFPGDIERIPRDPAKKLSSGYKATEKYIYVFSLGPGHFRGLVPQPYYSNFCRLVVAVRILLQYSITKEEYQRAYSLLVQFVEEYETLYYQRRSDRIHFCRPAIHSLLHLPLEGIRVGPGSLYTQFPLERLIGYLGSDLRQPSNPFSNFIQLTLLHAQLCALGGLAPRLFRTIQSIPKCAQKLRNDYILLHPRDMTPKVPPSAREADLLDQHFHTRSVQRWGRIRLRDGAIARSLYDESRKTSRRPRITRNVKIRFGNTFRIAEVQ